MAGDNLEGSWSQLRLLAGRGRVGAAAGVGGVLAGVDGLGVASRQGKPGAGRAVPAMGMEKVITGSRQHGAY